LGGYFGVFEFILVILESSRLFGHFRDSRSILVIFTFRDLVISRVFWSVWSFRSYFDDFRVILAILVFLSILVILMVSGLFCSFWRFRFYFILLSF
jgi:hypothetical protein